MIVLSAIGRFFKKIWDWIKQTAWIQPLLIVGIIFGVIFSIRPIVDAVKKGKKEQSTYAAYYNKVDFMSLEGGADSKADRFTASLHQVLLGNDTKLSDEFSYLGEKFFVIYVDENCSECNSAKEGFIAFQENLESRYKISGYDSHLVSIFTDEETSSTTEEESAFKQYCSRNLEFFEFAGGAGQSTDYYAKNQSTLEKDMEQVIIGFDEYIPAPTIFLVELGDTATTNKKEPGITEIMFGVKGSEKYDKGQTLADCWNHEGEFSHNAK